MKLLLDTHVFLWWDDDQARWSRTALAACLDPANSLTLSIASIWKIQIKVNLGRLALRLSLADVLDAQQRRRMQIEPVGVEDVLGLAKLPALHRDSFDRMLVAQVARYDVPVLW